MNTKTLRIIEVLTLSISITVTILVKQRAAGWSAEFDLVALLLLCWVVSPYIIFFGLSIVSERLTRIPQAPLVACVVSLLMLAFTLFTYVGTLGDRSSTYALIFVFIPLWLHMGSFALYLGGLVVAGLLERRKDGNI